MADVERDIVAACEGLLRDHLGSDPTTPNYQVRYEEGEVKPWVLDTRVPVRGVQRYWSPIALFEAVLDLRLRLDVERDLPF